MKKVLYIIFIPLISLTIPSCGGSRMTDAYLPIDQGVLNTGMLVVGIGIVCWIYDYFTKD